MILARPLLLALALLLSACATAPKSGSITQATQVVASGRPLILVSIDGFRADYLERGVTPTLSRLAGEGVRVRAMRPSFPSVTFPNHYTLVTGLRPDHHGVVNNSMEDPAFPGERFTMATTDAKWWNDGEPIWVTARKAGLKSAVMFWPGSESPIHDLLPDRWMKFDKSLVAEGRVSGLLAWFQAEKPAFATLYFDDVDTIGHRYGPDAPETNAALARVDAAIGALLAGLKAQGLTEDQFDIIVTADHGMAALKGPVLLDDMAKGSARIVSAGAVSNIEPLPGREKEAQAQFVGRHEHITCWRKQDVPRRFHYGSHRRIPGIVCLTDMGWYGVVRGAGGAVRTPSKGLHGFDPYSPEMAALFLAHGPSFKRAATVPAMDNVDVYPLAMRLLGLEPLANDGDAAFSAKVLRAR